MSIRDAAAGAGDPRCLIDRIGFGEIANCDRMVGGKLKEAPGGGGVEAVGMSPRDVASRGTGTVSSKGDQKAVRKTV